MHTVRVDGAAGMEGEMGVCAQGAARVQLGGTTDDVVVR